MQLRFTTRRLAIAVVLVALVAVTIGRPARVEANGGLVECRITVDGVQRLYRVLPAADPSKPAPVIVVLHGGTQSAVKMFGPRAGATRGWIDIARANNAVLVAPNGIDPETGDGTTDNQVWNVLGRARQGYPKGKFADDVAFIKRVMAEVQANYRTDPSRVFVTGASNGGMMTYRLLIEAPELFAAGAAFITSLPAELDKVPKPARPTPLMIYNGTADPLLPYGGGKTPSRWGRERGAVAAVPAAVAWWIAANRASPVPSVITTLPHREAADPCLIERREHTAGAGGAPVTVYTATGGGHALPALVNTIPDNFLIRRFIGTVCRDADGPTLAWDFLSRHRRP